jgi:hypothetical protein
MCRFGKIMFKINTLQGKLKQLSSNEKSMGTVVGIIDGTGSLGAAFGQFIVNITS